MVLSFCLGLPVLAQGLKSAGSVVGGIAGTAGADTYKYPQDLIGTGLNAALTLVGLIFLILMVYAGYLWLTARGEEEPITKAKKIITSSLIGFVLVASAYSITVFVGKRFEKGGGGSKVTATLCSSDNPTWACQDINGCNWKVEVEKKWDNCGEDTSCVKNACPGQPDAIVCCEGKASADGAGTGDPNKDVCCQVCEKTGKLDFSGCEYEAEPQHEEWVKEPSCNIFISKCEESGDCSAQVIEVATSEACTADKAKADCNQIYLNDASCGEDD